MDKKNKKKIKQIFRLLQANLSILLISIALFISSMKTFGQCMVTNVIGWVLISCILVVGMNVTTFVLFYYNNRYR